MEETYIGDGVYASFDGYQIWLRAQREGQENRIAIEPPVLGALNRYAEKLAAAEAEAATASTATEKA